MAWEEDSRICLHMQLIAILSRIGVMLMMSMTRPCDISCDILVYWPDIISTRSMRVLLTNSRQSPRRLPILRTRLSNVLKPLSAGLRTCKESRLQSDLHSLHWHVWLTCSGTGLCMVLLFSGSRSTSADSASSSHSL